MFKSEHSQALFGIPPGILVTDMSCFLCGSSSPMSLKESLDECMEALDLFLNNHFSESLERLRPR